MTKKEVLMSELDQAPAEIIDEVLDFIRFLKTKKKQENIDTALMSESSLKKDWLTPEEDEAWKDL